MINNIDKLDGVIKLNNGNIAFDYKDIKKSLLQQMDIYKNLELSEEKKQELKNDVATLRKMQKAINDKKKEVKKEYMKPLNEFEENSNELINIIDEPIEIIASKIKEFDQKRRNEKMNLIKDSFLLQIDDMEEYISFDNIFDESWLNTNVSMKKINENINSIIKNISSDIITIKSMKSDVEEEALIIYKENRKLSDAINHIHKYENFKKKILKQNEEENKEDKETEEKIEQNCFECNNEKTNDGFSDKGFINHKNNDGFNIGFRNNNKKYDAIFRIFADKTEIEFIKDILKHEDIQFGIDEIRSVDDGTEN